MIAQSDKPIPIQTSDGTIFGDLLQNGKILIKKGSFFRNYETPSLMIEHKNTRQLLINGGYVDTKRWLLIKDCQFDSPSDALCVLTGSKNNNNIRFVTQDNVDVVAYLDNYKRNDNVSDIFAIEKDDCDGIVSSLDVNVETLDNAISPSIKVLNTFDRERSVSKKAILLSSFKCEIDDNHVSFITKNGLPYMEAHHLIPLHAQLEFARNLDTLANVVCLCPNCHRRLHYGNDSTVDLTMLYNRRKSMLIESGIVISLESLLKYYK